MQAAPETNSKMDDSQVEVLAPTPIMEPVQHAETAGGPSTSTTACEPASTGNQSTENQSNSMRYIPEHKKHDAALTFPEKLMNMMKFADKQDHESFCIAWLDDGKSFVIRNPHEFTRSVVPKFFKATKFSSFTRKLYRWGFRQVNRGIGPDDPIIFGNDHFQRDNLELMTQMRSTTAATIRKQEENNVHWLSQKRALESIEVEQNAKRMFLMNQFMKQKNTFTVNPGMLANSGNMNLSQAMMGNMGRIGNMNMTNNGFGLMNQFGVQNHFMNSFPQNSFNGFNVNQNGHGIPNPSSTADIVNAAINALRYAP